MLFEINKLRLTAGEAQTRMTETRHGTLLVICGLVYYLLMTCMWVCGREGGKEGKRNLSISHAVYLERVRATVEGLEYNDQAPPLNSPDRYI